MPFMMSYFVAIPKLHELKRAAYSSRSLDPVSAEMQKRPAGIAALIKAFREFPFDRNMLRSATFPVLYAYGDLSHEEQALKAGILAQLFSDIHVHRYAGVHHFVPADQIYTADHAALLLDLWLSAERSASELSQK